MAVVILICIEIIMIGVLIYNFKKIDVDNKNYIVSKSTETGCIKKHN